MSAFNEFGESYLKGLISGLEEMDLGPVEQARELILRQSRQNHHIYLIGNGGSASLASHMATDLQLAGVRALALTDVAALSTYGNDFGYEQSFSRQVSQFLRVGDVLIAISGSGNSVNIINAIAHADVIGAHVIAITGFNGGRIGSSSRVDIHLRAPVGHMGIAQDLHQVMLHIICYQLMEPGYTWKGDDPRYIVEAPRA